MQVEGFSIDGQLHTLRQEVNESGDIVVKEYIDAGISGKSLDNRNGIRQLLKDAELGLFDMVVVWRISRVSRNTSDFLNILDRLKKHKVELKSIKENFDSNTPQGRFAYQMFAATAELEIRGMGENISNSMLKRMREGYMSGQTPYGYTRDEHKNVMVYEPEAKVVRQIFQMYLEGNGYKKIAMALDEMGVKSKKGSKMSPATVCQMLSKEVFNGIVRMKNHRRKMTYLSKGNFEPIISDELWFAVQKRRLENSTKNHNQKKHSSLVNGILLCSVCGKPMYLHKHLQRNKNGTTKDHFYYECSTRKQYGDKCKSNYIRRDKIDPKVMNVVTKTLTSSSYIDDIVESLNTRLEQHETSSLVDLEKRASDIKKQIKELYKAFEKETVTVEDFSHTMQVLKEESVSIETKIDEIKKTKVVMESKRVNRETVVELMDKVIMKLQEEDHNKLEVLIKQLVATVRLTDDDNIEVEFHDNVLKKIEEITEQSA